MYRITPMYPEDPRAPFYAPGAREVPPMARLYLTREKLISRSCDEEVLQQLVAEEEENTQTVDRREFIQRFNLKVNSIQAKSCVKLRMKQ